MRIAGLLWLLVFFYAAHAQKTYQVDTVGQQKMNALRQQYYTSKNDTVKLQALITLTNVYSHLNDFKNELFYNNLKGKLSGYLKLSQDSKIALAGLKGEASYQFCQAEIFKRQGNYQKALIHYFIVYDLYLSFSYKEQAAVTLSHIASTYSEMGNYNESLIYSFKALKSQEALGNEDHIAVELNNIGAIYSDTHEYSKALLYNTKARDISQKNNDKESMALYTGNIGHCYQMLCDSAFAAGNKKLSQELQDKALGYYLNAYKLSESVSDPDNMAVCMENIGIIYYNIDKYKEALPYLLKALDTYKALGLNADQSYCLHLIGGSYHGIGEDKKAEDYFNESLKLAKQTGSNYYLMEANLGNSEFYEKTKRPDKALLYYKAYIQNKDSIFNNENTKAFARTELNYEFAKKEAAIKFENDKMVYQLEAQNKLYRQWRSFFIVVIALAFVVLFFVKRAYDNKKKLAVLLKAEDQRKDVLLQEVHHRINNNLQIISSLLTLQANNADDEKLSEYLMQSQNRIQSLAAMHELLYDTNSPLHINMEEYISKVLDFHRDVAASLSAYIIIEEEIESVNFPTKLAVPIALVINELVTNSLKYAFTDRKNGVIKVTLHKQVAGNWMMTVSDNGKGLPPEGGGRKDSLGLKLVHIMTRQMKGTLAIKSENGAWFSLLFDVVKK